MLAGTAIGDRVPPRWCVNVNIIEYYKYIYSKYCIVLRGADVYFDILVFANPFKVDGLAFEVFDMCGKTSDKQFRPPHRGACGAAVHTNITCDGCDQSGAPLSRSSRVHLENAVHVCQRSYICHICPQYTTNMFGTSVNISPNAILHPLNPGYPLMCRTSGDFAYPVKH